MRQGLPYISATILILGTKHLIKHVISRFLVISWLNMCSALGHDILCVWQSTAWLCVFVIDSLFWSIGLSQFFSRCSLALDSWGSLSSATTVQHSLYIHLPRWCCCKTHRTAQTDNYHYRSIHENRGERAMYFCRLTIRIYRNPIS